MELASIDSVTTAFAAGLITSLHCVGMCGPLACAVVPLRGDRADAQIVSTIYHVTRLAGYSVLGDPRALVAPVEPESMKLRFSRTPKKADAIVNRPRIRPAPTSSSPSGIATANT